MTVSPVSAASLPITGSATSMMLSAGARRPRQPDQARGQAVAAPLVPGHQPGLAQQGDIAVDAGQRDAGGGAEPRSGVFTIPTTLN